MPTKRKYAACITTRYALVVAGGLNGKYLDVVEVIIIIIIIIICFTTQVATECRVRSECSGLC